MNRTLSAIAVVALAGAGLFTGGCATHREVVAAPPPAVETQTTQQTDQTQMNEQPVHRGERG